MMRSISEIADQYGIKMTECENQHGAIFTTPEWDDWPDEMYEEVETEGYERRRGPSDDYWVIV